MKIIWVQIGVSIALVAGCQGQQAKTNEASVPPRHLDLPKDIRFAPLVIVPAYRRCSSKLCTDYVLPPPQLLNHVDAENLTWELSVISANSTKAKYWHDLVTKPDPSLDKALADKDVPLVQFCADIRNRVGNHSYLVAYRTCVCGLFNFFSSSEVATVDLFLYDTTDAKLLWIDHEVVSTPERLGWRLTLAHRHGNYTDVGREKLKSLFEKSIKKLYGEDRTVAYSNRQSLP